uniref:ribose-5-phosphate isomerase n=1 Tax=Plectus sambesii TaxID=2011161 RepID=A0A914XJ46_9BILA
MSNSNGSDKNGEKRNPVDAAKRRAAFYCAEKHVSDGCHLGVGSGSTIRHFVDSLAARFKEGKLKNIVCVPTSIQTRQWLLEAGLPVSDVEQTPELDLCVDGADEIDPALNCIKGGGGCLTQEKIVQSCARRFIVVVDQSKKSSRLGEHYKNLPIEVVPFGYASVKRKIEASEGGKCVLRMAKQKCGPVVTDNNNYIIDWEIPKEGSKDWSALHTRLVVIPGVVETGLFIGVAERAYFGMEDGSVCELVKPGTTNGGSTNNGETCQQQACNGFGGRIVAPPTATNGS